MVANEASKQAKKEKAIPVQVGGYLSESHDVDFSLRGRFVIHEIATDFTPYAEVIIKRTYARGDETWGDIVLRVIETIFYFKKKQQLSSPIANTSGGTGTSTLVYWDEEEEQELAFRMAVSMAKVQWLPPGRGLQMCRRDYVDRFGSFALNNCGFTTSGYYDPSTNGRYERGREPFKFTDERSNGVFMEAIDWFMRVTMLGVGVGYNTYFNGIFFEPAQGEPELFVIQDTRESWAEATVRLLACYLVRGTREVTFDYSLIRPKGAPLKSTGGYASGPQPLILCHHIIRALCRCRLAVQGMAVCHAPGGKVIEFRKGANPAAAIRDMLLERMPHDIEYLQFEEPSAIPRKLRWFAEHIERLDRIVNHWDELPEDGSIVTIDGHELSRKTYGTSRFCVDVFNTLAFLTESGNMRRIATIALGCKDDAEFVRLKDWRINGERDFMHTSNNSIQLWYEDEYEAAAKLVGPLASANGEPGIVNMCAICTADGRGVVDVAMGVNPCTEANLGDKELCCLVENYPARCATAAEHYAACRYSAIYAAVVSCIPTGDARSDSIISRNHRIGASHTGLFEFCEKTPRAEYITRMSTAARIISDTCNEYVGRVAYGAAPGTATAETSPFGVAGAYCIRTRAIKPSGTVAPLGRASPGLHPFIQSRYIIRRMRMSKIDPLAKRLVALGVPHEIDVCNVTAYVFEFVLDQGECRTAADVSMWELWDVSEELQRVYTDQSNSMSLYFKPHEAAEIPRFLRRILPRCKVLSFMPLNESAVYPQQPYESITRDEYERRAAAMPNLDLAGVRAEIEFVAGCDGGACELPKSRGVKRARSS